MIYKLFKKIKHVVKENENLSFFLKNVSFKIAEILVILVDDEKYITKQYKRKTGKNLDLKAPVLYNEKIQWLKLYYRNPILNICVDKHLVKEYVSQNIIGSDSHIIPTIDVFNCIDDVDFSKLPDSFIMKLTNGSSFNYICNQKSDASIKIVKSRFKKWQKINYFAIGREWAYKDVKNRIICEPLLLSVDGNLPEDYKFYCFNGRVEVIAVNLDLYKNGKRKSNFMKNLYDREWNFIDGTIEYPNNPNQIVEKPRKLNEMIEFAEEISKDFPSVRVDMYYVDDVFYFGELTFYPTSGYQLIQPKELEIYLGNKFPIDQSSV
jgi:hypothetical protein